MVSLINKQTALLAVWIILGIIISYMSYRHMLIKYYHVEAEKVKYTFIVKEFILLVSATLGLGLYFVTAGITMDMLVQYLSNLSIKDMTVLYASYTACQIAVCIMPLLGTDIGWGEVDGESY